MLTTFLSLYSAALFRKRYLDAYNDHVGYRVYIVTIHTC